MKHWKSDWLSGVVVFALTLSVFSACDEAAGPEDVDPVKTTSTVESAISQYITDNPALQSLDVLGPAIGGALNVSPAFFLAPEPGFGNVRELGSGIWEAVRDAQVSRESSGARLLASIPVGVLGKTFVYNLVTGAYEIDETRTDAPDDGVRFALYAVDPVLGQPVEPLNEIGYFDIIDTSSLPTVSVSLIAVIDTDTLISYSVIGTFSETASSSISVTGFISDGTSQLNFDLDFTEGDSTFSATLQLSLGSVNVNIQVDENETTGVASVSVEISDGDNTIVLLFSEDGQDNITEGTISFNGTTVAILSGTDENLVITNAEGGELTQAEISALADLFHDLGEMFDTVEGLLEVAFLLLGLGLI